MEFKVVNANDEFYYINILVSGEVIGTVVKHEGDLQIKRFETLEYANAYVEELKVQVGA